MPEQVFRRTLTLGSDRKDDLARIRSDKDISTDSAAINYAVRFSAKFCENEADIAPALSLWRKLKQHGGATVIIEPNDNSGASRLFIPNFGSASI